MYNLSLHDTWSCEYSIVNLLTRSFKSFMNMCIVFFYNSYHAKYIHVCCADYFCIPSVG